MPVTQVNPWMRRLLLFVLVVLIVPLVLVVGFATIEGVFFLPTKTPITPITPVPSKTPTPTAIHWIYDLDRFQAHINEYLDPEWTDTAPGYPYLFREGYIRGGLVVVSADTGQVISPLNWETPYMGTE